MNLHNALPEFKTAVLWRVGIGGLFNHWPKLAGKISAFIIELSELYVIFYFVPFGMLLNVGKTLEKCPFIFKLTDLFHQFLLMVSIQRLGETLTNTVGIFVFLVLVATSQSNKR